MKNNDSFEEVIKEIVGSKIESPSLSFERNLLIKINKRKNLSSKGEKYILIGFFTLMMIITALLFSFNLVESGGISEWIIKADKVLSKMSFSATLFYSAGSFCLFLMIQTLIINKRMMKF